MYLGALNIKEAIEIAETELLSVFYKPINTYAAFEIALEGYPLKADLVDILRNGGIWYGPFQCYPSDRKL
jgi:hypothetical protein